MSLTTETTASGVNGLARAYLRWRLGSRKVIAAMSAIDILLVAMAIGALVAVLREDLPRGLSEAQAFISKPASMARGIQVEGARVLSFRISDELELTCRRDDFGDAFAAILLIGPEFESPRTGASGQDLAGPVTSFCERALARD